MTSTASWQAFQISTAAAVPWGPIGWATILPELIAVTKIQVNLIYKIAKYHGKLGQLNKSLVVLVFANQAGLTMGRHLMHKIGPKLVIRSLGSKAIRPIAQRIAAKVGTRISRKLAGRWIPVVLAPLFGAFSKSMTTEIGRTADWLFSHDIEVVDSTLCPNGHEVTEEARFCQECGASMKGKEAA